MTAKHAICIIAHKNVEQINLLIHLLDHPLIGIFLHLDKKSRISYDDIKRPNHLQITFAERHDVRWGDMSIVETELELWGAVVNSKIKYEYAHLISAQDMPVKSVDYIVSYFDKADNRGKEFIGVWHSDSQINRLKYYWLYTKHMRHRLIYKIIRHGSLALQSIVGTDSNQGVNKPLESVSQALTETSDVEALEKEIARLKKELAHESLRANASFDTMINIAEKQFNIPIRKKSGTRQ